MTNPSKYDNRARAEDVAKLTREAQRTTGVGLVCSRCGCHNFATAETRRGDNEVRRSRVCRVCGWRLTTTEIPTS